MSFDAADLACFVDADMPGYALGTLGGGATVGGLFEDGPASVFDGLVSGQQLAFRVLTVDAASIARDTTIAIGGHDYRVIDIAPGRSASGLTRLVLERL